MKVLPYPIASRSALTLLLRQSESVRELPLLQAPSELREDDWLVLDFRAPDITLLSVCTAKDSGGEMRLSFEERDWESLQRRLVRGAMSARPTLESPRPAVILAVDDDPEQLRLLEALLGQTQTTVLTAASAEQAFECLRERAVGLIISDCDLSGMSGPDFCRRVRKDRTWSRIPILLLSGRSERELALEVQLGFSDDFISKPFRASELIARALALL